MTRADGLPSHEMRTVTPEPGEIRERACCAEVGHRNLTGRRSGSEIIIDHMPAKCRHGYML